MPIRIDRKHARRFLIDVMPGCSGNLNVPILSAVSCAYSGVAGGIARGIDSCAVRYHRVQALMMPCLRLMRNLFRSPGVERSLKRLGATRRYQVPWRSRRGQGILIIRATCRGIGKMKKPLFLSKQRLSHLVANQGLVPCLRCTKQNSLQIKEFGSTFAVSQRQSFGGQTVPPVPTFVQNC